MIEFSDWMEILNSCPLCGSKYFSLSYKPDVCKCKECKVLFRNPRPKQEIIIDCYDQGVTFQEWQNELEIRSYLWKKRLSLVKSYRTNGSLLDIGTGDGYFLNFAKIIFKVEATEISTMGVHYAESWGHVVHHGTIFDTEYNERKYDIITMWHVLEHLPDPGKALNRVMQLLNPGGLIFIAVPNELSRLYSLAALTKKKHPFGKLGCDGEIHLTHYTPRVLLNFLKSQQGLEVLNVGVDDVHIYNRKIKLPGMYLNMLLCKLLRFHFDAAMVFVCSKSKKII